MPGVSWISSNTSIATITSTGSSTVLTKVADGDVKITATVTACGAILPSISKTIIVGIPQYTYEIVPFPISSHTQCHKLNKTYTFKIQPTGIDPYYSDGTYQWYCTGIGLLSSTSKTVSLQFTQPGDYTLSVRPNSPCGLGPVSVYSESLHASSSCSVSGFYLVYPNPAATNLSIEMAASNTDHGSSSKNNLVAGFDRIEVLDKMGKVVIRRTYHRNTKKVILNVSTLRSDVYVLRIFNENDSEEHKIIVRY